MPIVRTSPIPAAERAECYFYDDQWCGGCSSCIAAGKKGQTDWLKDPENKAKYDEWLKEVGGKGLTELSRGRKGTTVTADKKVQVGYKIASETKELVDSMAFALEKDKSDIIEEAIRVYWNSQRDQAGPKFKKRVAEFEMAAERGSS